MPLIGGLMGGVNCSNPVINLDPSKKLVTEIRNLLNA